MSTHQPLQVLLAIHPDLDLLDLAGPLELFSHSKITSSATKAFNSTITAVSEYTTTAQGLTVKRHISIPEAHSTLADYDILVIPGGGSEGILGPRSEPIDLVKAFAALPKKKDGGIRTLLSVCTGGLFLAEAGVLAGQAATTHYLHYDKLREIAATKGETKVVEERFVVNKVDEERGLRIITSGGVSCGIDATLWLIASILGKESKDQVARLVQYESREAEGFLL